MLAWQGLTAHVARLACCVVVVSCQTLESIVNKNFSPSRVVLHWFCQLCILTAINHASYFIGIAVRHERRRAL
jgi:hypothetical protein